MERVTVMKEFFELFSAMGTILCTVTGRRKYSAELAQDINKSHLLHLPHFVLSTPSLNSCKCEDVEWRTL